ncbi:hypothetical protein AMS68_002621 [Peltaster fructicola]|uniref:Adenosine deaminase domain-containing protein n=1 Tax=Peltaster fructicola TaxID=286661 RepID=A0A6H0XQU7_9PEZI|nr:hypothetical protein AMS68_002621 [Peltaster fructicola]
MESKLRRKVDQAFAKALPKVELHAHLSGSISKDTLHKIWTLKQAEGHCLDLDDPLMALREMPDIFTFFKIFDQYIYKLIDDKTALQLAVRSVIADFENDGVRYLELRTTPRQMAARGLDRRAYVETVLEAIGDRPTASGDGHTGIEVHLLLSIDRRMTFDEAAEVLDVAESFSYGSLWHQQHQQHPVVLGIDLCGNPMKGDVSVFTPLFLRAQRSGLRTTVHFAEVSESSTEKELTTILSWKPDRLGHVIHVSDHIKAMIQDQGVALELCLSCNMIAKMVKGEFADHHFGYWLRTTSAIALSTDDVGVFQSSLSNEYLIAAEHFDLDTQEIVSLSYRSIDAAFKGHDRMRSLLATFEEKYAQ